MNGGISSGKSFSTLVEDANVTVDADDTDTDIGDSPCPPPTKASMMTKGKRGVLRSETYGPSNLSSPPLTFYASMAEIGCTEKVAPCD